jgi:hypothetical protein
MSASPGPGVKVVFACSIAAVPPGQKSLGLGQLSQRPTADGVRVNTAVATVAAMIREQPP